MPKLKTKKDLKKFINENGFFVQTSEIERLSVNENNEIVTVDNNSIKTKAKLPKGDNIIVFRGIITQQFKKGETNRNGYKIDVSGWDWKNYKKNPVILLQHDADHPIGKALEIIENEKNIELIYFVNLDWVDGEANKARVAEGAFSAMSTGSMVIEYMFEHKKTGERITPDEFWQLSWEEGKNYDYVVTKAEGIENSVVAIGSNPDALTVTNALEIFFNKLAMKDKKEIAENSTEEVIENEVIEKEEEKEEVTTPETPETPENGGEGSDTPTEPEEPEEVPAENAETPEAETPENGDEPEGDDSPEEVEEKNDSFVLPEKVRDSIQSIVDANANLVKENALQANKIAELEKKLDNTPNKKVRVVNQFAEKTAPKADSGKNALAWLKNQKIEVQ